MRVVVSLRVSMSRVSIMLQTGVERPCDAGKEKKPAEKNYRSKFVNAAHHRRRPIPKPRSFFKRRQIARLGTTRIEASHLTGQVAVDQVHVRAAAQVGARSKSSRAALHAVMSSLHRELVRDSRELSRLGMQS
jgi:hypothetical protein